MNDEMNKFKKCDVSWPNIAQCLYFMNERMESGLLSPESLELIQECLEMTKTKVEMMLSRIDKVVTMDDEVWRKMQLFKRPIETLDLPVRAYNVLRTEKIKTIGQLVKFTESYLLGTMNFGPISLVHLNDSLSDIGLTLGMDIENE